MAESRPVHRKTSVNDRGYPIGEQHHNATIPDAVVVRIRDLREYEHVTLPEIARRMEVKLETVRAIVYYRRRAQVAARWVDSE